MKHQTTITKGTDPRNHKVNCSCGWAYASTMNDIKDRELFHVQNAPPVRWDSPIRKRSDEQAFVPKGHWTKERTVEAQRT